MKKELTPYTVPVLASKGTHDHIQQHTLMWQSQVKNEQYSITYSIVSLNSKHCNYELLLSGAHTCCVEASHIALFTHCIRDTAL